MFVINNGHTIHFCKIVLFKLVLSKHTIITKLIIPFLSSFCSFFLHYLDLAEFDLCSCSSIASDTICILKETEAINEINCLLGRFPI